MKKWLSMVLVGATLCLPFIVRAQSSSSNFVLWDAATTSGGANTTSGHYIDFGSVSDFASPTTTSTNYRSYNGFEAIYAEPVITMSVSPNSIALSPNPLTISHVSTGTTTVTVSTDAPFGYSLTATDGTAFQSDSGHVLAGVTGGTVTAGTEGFGVAVAGSDASFANDEAVSSTPLLIASKDRCPDTNGCADRALTVTVKAAISSTTAAGAYAGSVTFIATGNY